MNVKLRAFEDAINRALDEADGELEIAEIIGVMQFKLHLMCQRCQRLQTRTVDQDPADSWKFLKDE